MLVLQYKTYSVKESFFQFYRFFFVSGYWCLVIFNVKIIYFFYELLISWILIFMLLSLRYDGLWELYVIFFYLRVLYTRCILLVYNWWLFKWSSLLYFIVQVYDFWILNNFFLLFQVHYINMGYNKKKYFMGKIRV